MLDFLAAPENLPFTVALTVMLLIGVVEALGLGGSAVNVDVGADADGGDLLGWLGFGRVPLLMVLVVFLAAFGLIGLGIQQALGPMSPWFASGLAALAALPVTGLGARGLARIMPQDETTAVSLDTLVGKRGTVTVGTARSGSPAQARVRDIHGQSHYVMVEPHDPTHSIAEGETVLLVRRDGHVFTALGAAGGIAPHPHEHLRIG
ncbi:MAG TPA: YqiJ family protein [Allosphingosinicella sp.]|nr:YqiJ family protein [Allosphingosinicella sp.]